MSTTEANSEIAGVSGNSIEPLSHEVFVNDPPPQDNGVLAPMTI